MEGVRRGGEEKSRPAGSRLHGGEEKSRPAGSRLHGGEEA